VSAGRMSEIDRINVERIGPARAERIRQAVEA
jgi:hypothetical protein